MDRVVEKIFPATNWLRQLTFEPTHAHFSMHVAIAGLHTRRYPAIILSLE
jgi:hypothetical protein